MDYRGLSERKKEMKSKRREEPGAQLILPRGFAMSIANMAEH